jgi:hypothetical protein
MSDEEERERAGLEEQSAELLPDREAMSVITPHPLPATDPDGGLMLPGSPGSEDPDPPPTAE